MSYDQYQKSTSRSGPVSLYEFTMGDTVTGNSYRYTDGDEDVWFNGNLYTRAAIDRDKKIDSGSLTKAEMKIRVASTNELARVFLSYPPAVVVSLQIHEGHFEDSDRQFLPLWTGRVLNCELAQKQAEFSCQPASTALKRPGLKRNYQKLCPLPLYGKLCRAKPAPETFNVQDFKSGIFQIELPEEDILNGIESFVNGIVRWRAAEATRDEVRPVLEAAISSDGLYGLIRIPGLSGILPATITILRGCNHTERTCAEWHGNLVNYGGQPFIPDNNPVNTTSTFY